MTMFLNHYRLNVNNISVSDLKHDNFLNMIAKCAD